MRNIILFSSGISEKNGMLPSIKELLENCGYRCAYWRDLFKQAKNPENIALLPSLIKKIPTFDYAILICEGHDKTIMLRDGIQMQVDSMRDNVLFEIGLCSMALGLSRTILLTDSNVHLPEDLTGKNGALAIRRFICEPDKPLERVVHEIHNYILEDSGELTPVVIGAASSSAEGYVNNFLLRALEHLEDGVFINDVQYHFSLDQVYVHVILPKKLNENTSNNAAVKLSDYERATVLTARSRSAVFQCKRRGEQLHIYDFPTSVITSYHTAKMILEIDADDSEDVEAAERFTAKEIKLFEATLKSLTKEKYVSQVINEYYQGISIENRNILIKKICNLFLERFYIEYE